jgi:hypothetical protein
MGALKMARTRSQMKWINLTNAAIGINSSITHRSAMMVLQIGLELVTRIIFKVLLFAESEGLLH